jgi:hypothetical protein
MKPSGARQRFSQFTGPLCKGKVAIVSFTSFGRSTSLFLACTLGQFHFASFKWSEVLA